MYPFLYHRHYRNATGALVVYDISNRSSFEAAGDWINMVRDRAEDNVMIGLIANKIDLPSNRRVVSQEEGQNLANMHKVFYKETTVEDVGSLRGAFERLAVGNYWMMKKSIEPAKQTTLSSVRIIFS